MRHFSVLTAAAALATIVHVAAQQPPAQFEAASVKVNASADTRGRFGANGPRLSATNYTLRDIIRNTWNVQRYQITGGPPWIDTTRFDIVAVATGTPGPPEFMAMMKTLLADRFKLAIHTESREMPIYALVVRTPGKLGPQLSPMAPGCEPRCGSLQTGPGTFRGRGATMPQFARNLSPFAGRSVIDETGLTGGYDLELTWSPDQGGANADADAPALVTAVQEQLGLKLDARRGPVDVLVIDRAEPPTED